MEEYEDYDLTLSFHAKNAISALNEMMRPRGAEVRFDYERTGPDHAISWVARVMLEAYDWEDGVSIVMPFEWTNIQSTTKEDAYKQAAKEAIYILQRKTVSDMLNANNLANASTPADVITLHDRVCYLAHEVHDLTERTMLEYFARGKILAAIIMKLSHGGNEEYNVISLGTGQRIIQTPVDPKTNTHIPLKSDGSCLLDLHAEVVTRRGLKRYLYQQLLKVTQQHSSHILEPSQTNGHKGLKYKLKDGVSFHLYISCPPCGDASVFRTKDAKDNVPLKRKEAERQGRLRAKLSDGEGAQPTIDLQNDGRLRLMSCSDKICLWNATGIQGALLSHFLEPIYLESITVGSQHVQQKDHFPRALFKRLDGLNELPHNYHINSPATDLATPGMVESWLPNQVKTSQYSTNWCEGDHRVEVVDAHQGTVINSFSTEQDPISRLSKQSFFKSFKELVNTHGKWNLDGLNYKEAKKTASRYQQTKAMAGQFLEGHAQNGHRVNGFKLGTWLKVTDTHNVDSFPRP